MGVNNLRMILTESTAQWPGVELMTMELQVLCPTTVLIFKSEFCKTQATHLVLMATASMVGTI